MPQAGSAIYRAAPGGGPLPDHDGVGLVRVADLDELVLPDPSHGIAPMHLPGGGEPVPPAGHWRDKGASSQNTVWMPIQTKPTQNSQPRSREVNPRVAPSTQRAFSGERLKRNEQTIEAATYPRMNLGNRSQASAASDVRGPDKPRSTHPAQ